MDLTNLSAWALRLGLRVGSFTGVTPEAFRMLSKLSVYSASRSCIKYFLLASISQKH